MGLIEGESPIPETYAGPASERPWWNPAQAKSAVFLDNIGWDEVMAQAGIDWTVTKRDLEYLAADDPNAPHRRRLKVPGWQATVRETDEAFLGMVTTNYEPIQNEVLRELGKAVTGESGAQPHTGGSLYGGRIVFLALKLDRTIYVKGDGSPIEDFLILYTGHDGRHALNALNSPTRVWCGNTLAQADSDAVARYVIQHRPGAMGHVEEARKALGLHDAYIARFEARMNELAGKDMTWSEIETFTRVLIPDNPKVDHPYRTQAARAQVLALFNESPTLDGVAWSAYRLYQAVAEYADHGITFRDTKLSAGADRRAISVIEGRAFDLKTDALRLLVKA